MPRTGNGLHTDMKRACDGHETGIVLERDACRAGGCVFVSCSFCVRSSFGRVLCGVRLVLVRVAFVRGGSQGEAWGAAADCGRRSVHIRTWERSRHGQTARRRSSEVRSLFVLRSRMHTDSAWTRDGRTFDMMRTPHGLLRTAHGRTTDGRRTRHGLVTES